MYAVQVGKGKNKYKVRYLFDSGDELKDWNNAVRHFNSLNTHSGHKKRIVNENGTVLARVIT